MAFGYFDQNKNEKNFLDVMWGAEYFSRFAVKIILNRK